eukprot:1078735-Alexandrium_andersonii.AAC.1
MRSFTISWRAGETPSVEKASWMSSGGHGQRPSPNQGKPMRDGMFLSLDKVLGPFKDVYGARCRAI